MKKLMEILGDKRELCRLLNEHKDMLKKVGIVVLVIVLGLVFLAVAGVAAWELLGKDYWQKFRSALS